MKESDLDTYLKYLESQLVDVKCFPSHVKVEKDGLTVCEGCTDMAGYKQATENHIEYLKELTK